MSSHLARPCIATDAPLSNLPSEESLPLSTLQSSILPTLRLQSPHLALDDPWRHLHEPEHTSLLRTHLIRYLRFNTLNVSKAAAHIESTIRWRAVYTPSHIPSRDIHGMQAGIPVGKLSARGANNEFLFFAAADRYLKRNAVAEAQTRATVRLFEDVIYGGVDGEGRGAVVVDFTGFGLGHVDIMGLKRGVATYVNYYPEAFYKVLLVNYPRLLHAVWKVIAPLLDQRTVSRVIWIAEGESVVHHLSVFDEKSLPGWMGGQGTNEDVTLFNGVLVAANDLQGRFG